jgi:hypothetical protein
MPTIVQKMARHPARTTICPPTSGPNERSNRHHRYQDRQHLGGPIPSIEITHHSARQSHAGTGPKSLHNTPADDRQSASRKSTTGRANHEQNQSDRHRGTSAIAVADRPPQKLPQTEPDQVAGNGPFDHTGICAKVVAHQWHRRQIKIGRNRRKPHQQAEDCEHAPTWGDRRLSAVALGYFWMKLIFCNFFNHDLLSSYILS